MEINEFKRELSKISGHDFFSPKYRDIFAKAFSSDGEEKDGDKKDIKDKTETEDNTDVSDKKEDTAGNATGETGTEVTETDTVKDTAGEAYEANETNVQTDTGVTETAPDNTKDELLDAKIENALLRGGIREEKLGAAKRLAHAEIHDISEIEKINGILKDFPEWVRGYKSAGFGMEIDSGTDNLTAEERRLKAMGIDPK